MSDSAGQPPAELEAAEAARRDQEEAARRDRHEALRREAEDATVYMAALLEGGLERDEARCLVEHWQGYRWEADGAP